MDKVFNSRIIVPVATLLGAAIALLYFIKKKGSEKKIAEWTFRELKQRELFIISSEDEWEEIYSKVKNKWEVIQAVGFDCEWVSSKKSHVAMIQIATYDGLCALIRIQHFKTIPDTLKNLLGDKSILKLGVASNEDGKRLFRDYGIAVTGCVDLRHVVARMPAFNYSNSLKSLGEVFLGVTMKKDNDIRCGDWEAELSPAQIDYAADDALFGIDIFLQMVVLKITGKSLDESKYFGHDVYHSKEEFWKTAKSMCQGVVDITYKRGNQNKTNDGTTRKDSEDEWEENNEDNYVTSATRALQKVVMESSITSKAFMPCQNASNDNCQLIARDGVFLSLCNMKGAQWYIDNNLGDKVSDDPFTVQLRFEPKNQPSSIKGYCRQRKESICVVCGSDKDCVNKYIVPKEYTKHFPAILKHHSTHDKLQLCMTCNQKCVNYEANLRHQLATECNAPLDSGKDSTQQVDEDLAKVVSAAKALLKSKDSIPKIRVLALENTVMNYYGVRSLSTELLEKAESMDTRSKNSSHIPHGRKVVDYYMTNGAGLPELETMWRRQFVDTMQPKFLPLWWSVELQIEGFNPITN